MTRRRAETAKNGVDQKAETVFCRDDEFRIGGGVAIKGSDDVHLLRTKPRRGGWVAEAAQHANDNEDWRLKVFVLCVEHPTG